MITLSAVSRISHSANVEIRAGTYFIAFFTTCRRARGNIISFVSSSTFLISLITEGGQDSVINGRSRCADSIETNLKLKLKTWSDPAFVKSDNDIN